MAAAPSYYEYTRSPLRMAKVRIFLYVSQDLFDWIDQKAADQGRSRNRVIIDMLIKVRNDAV